MRYPACEKLEIIRLVEQSHLPVMRTLDKIGIPRATFYRWYDLYRCGGPEALEDGCPGPDRAWNRIPEEVQGKLVDLALEDGTARIGRIVPEGAISERGAEPGNELQVAPGLHRLGASAECRNRVA
jgi:transposase-like protein